MTLHSEQDAVREAVLSAGYGLVFGKVSPRKCEAMILDISIKADTFQDPAFWQALGKARGWEEKLPEPHGSADVLQNWKYYALIYFETLLSGGDMKAFWESLP